MDNITILDTTYNETLKIEISEQFKTEISGEVAPIQNPVTRHRSYLNLLIRKSFLAWINLMLETNFTDDYLFLEQVSIWEFINGNTIDIEGTKFVLIPMETEDKSEFTIAEEWLHLPDFVGAYYLPIGVNLNDNYLDFWGYMSYEDLLRYGELDIINHHFDLPSDELESDLNLIALEYEYEWQKTPQISPFNSLSTIAKQQLIEQAKGDLFPRYSLEFKQWLYLIEDSQTRPELYIDRQPINLSQWLNQKIESALVTGWQNAQEIIDGWFTPQANWQPILSSRSLVLSLEETLANITQSDDITNINSLVNTIPNLIEDDRQKNDTIDTLSNLINNSSDEEKRWSLALCLNQLDNEHPNSPSWYHKQITFDGEESREDKEEKINFFLGILPKSSQEISIFIHLYSQNKNQFLPSNLSLQIIDEDDNIYQEIITDRNDKAIQYKFWGNQGESFILKVLYKDHEYSQQFTV